MKNKAYLLPACKTADGVPIGIGSEVYAITFKQKVNKYGRLYRPSTRDLAVVKVTVSTVTFSEFVEPGWFGWTGVAYKAALLSKAQEERGALWDDALNGCTRFKDAALTFDLDDTGNKAKKVAELRKAAKIIFEEGKGEK